MELLILKAGPSYLRIVENGYELVNMSKASVYPLNQKDKVLSYFDLYKNKIVDLEIKKLRIIEEDFIQD